jgi:hypothetical protein
VSLCFVAAGLLLLITNCCIALLLAGGTWVVPRALPAGHTATKECYRAEHSAAMDDSRSVTSIACNDRHAMCCCQKQLMVCGDHTNRRLDICLVPDIHDICRPAGADAPQLMHHSLPTAPRTESLAHDGVLSTTRWHCKLHQDDARQGMRRSTVQPHNDLPVTKQCSSMFATRRPPLLMPSYMLQQTRSRAWSCYVCHVPNDAQAKLRHVMVQDKTALRCARTVQPQFM